MVMSIAGDNIKHSYYSKAIIIVSLEEVYYQIMDLFRNELSKFWFENNEIDEIIKRIFDITVRNILNDIDKCQDLYNQCYLGNIDYLEYCGVSQSTAFKITHLCEMGILKAIFDTCPTLDDKDLFSIQGHNILNMTDLHIVVHF